MTLPNDDKRAADHFHATPAWHRGVAVCHEPLGSIVRGGEFADGPSTPAERLHAVGEAGDFGVARRVRHEATVSQNDTNASPMSGIYGVA